MAEFPFRMLAFTSPISRASNVEPILPNLIAFALRIVRGVSVVSIQAQFVRETQA